MSPSTTRNAKRVCFKGKYLWCISIEPNRRQCCLYLDEKSHFSNDDFDFPIFGGLHCLSTNIIYIIECKACGDKYVGETGRCLKDRMFNHISDIRRDKNGPVSRHFNNAGYICFGADRNLILGCLWLLVFVLNNIFILGIWCSTIPHLPGCFCPWTFFENIGFNTVLTDPFMSHLATQLGYSAGEFQTLQLIVLAAFGVVD